MNLFLVENSNYLRERLTRLVGRRQDVQVLGFAATARDAVQGIRQLKPDVVLLDIRLDQGSGLDVLKQIKKRGQPPVVIVLTNYAYPQYRDRFIASGADYFFDKSTELDLMLQALETLRYRFPPQQTGPTARGSMPTAGRLHPAITHGGKYGH
jgi:DNA-binding NarL/FixJ family response regulator